MAKKYTHCAMCRAEECACKATMLEMVDNEMTEAKYAPTKLPNIIEIDEEKANEILNSKPPKIRYEPLGKFLFIDSGGKCIGIDNSSGNAWTEEFDSRDDCITWLQG